MPTEHCKNADAYTLDAQIQEYQGLIKALARRLHCEWIHCDDLVQAGNLGLMKAISHYDASHNAKLMTYAVPWILGEMRCMIRREGKTHDSLDQPMDDESRTLHDIIPGTQSIDLGRLDLRLALSRLKREEQILICLRYFRDKTQKEAAALLGKSQAQISKMERRALDALHGMLS